MMKSNTNTNRKHWNEFDCAGGGCWMYIHCFWWHWWAALPTLWRHLRQCPLWYCISWRPIRISSDSDHCSGSPMSTCRTQSMLEAQIKHISNMSVGRKHSKWAVGWNLPSGACSRRSFKCSRWSAFISDILLGQMVCTSQSDGRFVSLCFYRGKKAIPHHLSMLTFSSSILSVSNT